MTKTHIRAANDIDIPLLSSIIRASLQDVVERFDLTPENCPKHPSNCDNEWIEKELARGVFYYILEDDNVPAGCIALEKTDDNICCIERLVVLPEHRRKGAGKALVEHAFFQARSLRASEISVGIIAGDQQLKQWYQNIGFSEGETREHEYLPFRVMYMGFRRN